MDEIITKKRLAELSFSRSQKKYLDLHHCDLSEEAEVREAIIRAVGAVVPLNISDFKRVAATLLEEEPKVVTQLSEVGADEETRQRLINHLVDATFSRCLTECLISV